MEKAERRRIDADQDVVFVPALNHASTGQKGPGATGTASPPRAVSFGAASVEGLPPPVSESASPVRAVELPKESTWFGSSGYGAEGILLLAGSWTEPLGAKQ